MENMEKTDLKNRSFTRENMKDFLKFCNTQEKLLPLYLDKIRNGYEFTTDIIENINNFDDKGKMAIICEYNRCYKIIYDTLVNDTLVNDTIVNENIK